MVFIWSVWQELKRVFFSFLKINVQCICQNVIMIDTKKCLDACWKSILRPWLYDRANYQVHTTNETPAFAVRKDGGRVSVSWHAIYGSILHFIQGVWFSSQSFLKRDNISFKYLFKLHKPHTNTCKKHQITDIVLTRALFVYRELCFNSVDNPRDILALIWRRNFNENTRNIAVSVVFFFLQF